MYFETFFQQSLIQTQKQHENSYNSVDYFILGCDVTWLGTSTHLHDFMPHTFTVETGTASTVNRTPTQQADMLS
jgi:hypothetical protein